jgi:cytochrome c oxidase subunit 4
MANLTEAQTSHEHHIVPTGTYILTLLALVVLMVITVAVAQVQIPDIGPFTGTVLNQVVALVIATIKAYLVITIFMGVKWATPLTKLWAATGFVWFTLMFLILGDYTTRRFEPVANWRPNPESSLPRVTHPGTPNPMFDPNEANLHPRD